MVSFFEEKESQQKESTPSLPEVLTRSIDSKLYDMRVCLPATVLKYDKKKQSVDVQPLLKVTYDDGTVEEMAPIFNVPVKHPRAGAAIIHMPIKKGHTVTLSFADRSLDTWKSKGGAVVPGDVRQHHLSDAFAYPGGYSFADAVEIDNENDIIIQNEGLEIRVKPNGHLRIKNQSQELVELMNRMLRIVREAVVYTGNGAQQLKHLEFSQLASDLKTFLEK